MTSGLRGNDLGMPTWTATSTTITTIGGCGANFGLNIYDRPAGIKSDRMLDEHAEHADELLEPVQQWRQFNRPGLASTGCAEHAR